MEPPWDGGMVDYSNGPLYMTSMAVMPITLNFKKYSSLKPKGSDIESWYVALGTLVLPSLFK